MTEPVILKDSELETKTWEEIESISSPANMQQYYDSTNNRRVCYLEGTGWVNHNVRM